MRNKAKIERIELLLLAPTGSGLEDTLKSLIVQKRTGGFKMNLILSAPAGMYQNTVCADIREKAEDDFNKIEIAVVNARYEDGTSCGYAECLAAAYNALKIKNSPGGAVLCCREGTLYSPKAFHRAAEALREGADMAALMTDTLRHTGSKLVKILHNPYEKLLPQCPDKGYVDIEKNPHFVHTAPDAYIFKSEILDRISDYQVDITQNNDAVHFFMLRIMEAAGGFYYIPEERCRIALALENSPAVFADQQAEWWYLPSLANWQALLESAKERGGEIHACVQYIAVHHVLSKIKCNFEDKSRGVLKTPEEIEQFYDSTAQVLRYIDDRYIVRWSEKNRWKGFVQSRNIGFHRCMLILLMRRKAKLLGGEAHVDMENGNIVLDMPSEKLSKGQSERIRTALCRADNEAVEINVINYVNGMLEIDGTLTCADLIEPERLKAFAVYFDGSGKETEIALEHYPVYPLIKCFGVTVAHKYNIHLSVPAERGIKCRFEYELCGQRFPMRLLFCGGFSRLVTDVGSAYWRFEKKLCLVCPDSRQLQVISINTVKGLAKETSFICSMLGYKGARKLIVLSGVGLRMLYLVTKPFRKGKNSVITFDKLYKAGDNGDYFFRYSQTRKDGKNSYYVLDRKASEYPDMKKKYRSKLLPSFTIGTMLKVLDSAVIAATHSTVLSYLGFPKPLQPFFRDLFGFKVACIQHGLTVQQLAQYQNRVFDNTTLYCLASKFEYNNLLQPIYGYKAEHLKMTGLARFDGLVNDDKRFILITPTWRRNVVNGGIAHIKKSHSDTFKGSEYFRIYNTLINDKKLIDTAKRCGYGITYLLHPAMSAQKDDFDSNDYVNIVAATGDMSYEKILTQASLMVTDYSGVQFDFAYMRKPIVYYHPETLPPQYETTSIDYANDGFGEICATHDSLVDTLCEYMENGCRCKEEYVTRADRFFAFSDHKSCERIFEEIKKFAEK